MHRHPIIVPTDYDLTQAHKADRKTALDSDIRVLGRLARVGLLGLADLIAEIARAYSMAHVLPFTTTHQ